MPHSNHNSNPGNLYFTKHYKKRKMFSKESEVESSLSPSRPNLKKQTPTRFIIFLLFSFLISSCAPTYPKEKVIESIVKISQEKYATKVEAKQINRTFSILINGEGFLETGSLGNIAFYPENEKKLNELIFFITRVLLNSDLDIDFYWIKVIEEKKGLELSVIGHVNDLKQSWVGSFSPGELFMRRVIEQKTGLERDPLGIKRFEEVSWPDFLLNQIRKRVILKFPGQVELTGNLTENKEFIFILATIQDKPKITHFTLQTIARVFDAYKFEDFKSINLLNLTQGKTESINKEKLKKYR